MQTGTGQLTGEDEIIKDGGRRFTKFGEFAELVTFSGSQKGKREEESEDGCDCVLVSNGAQSLLDAPSSHQFLILVTLDGGE